MRNAPADLFLTTAASSQQPEDYVSNCSGKRTVPNEHSNTVQNQDSQSEQIKRLQLGYSVLKKLT